MAVSTLEIHLPNLMDYCPLPIFINQRHHWLKEQSTRWILEQGFMTLQDQESWDGELLANVVHPHADNEELNIICDFFNLLMAADDLTDSQGARNAQMTCDVFLGSLRHPSTPSSSNFSRAVADFAKRYKLRASPSAHARFMKHIESYLNAVASQATLRDSQVTPALEPFVIQRRENCSMKACYDLIELELGIDLPDKIYDDPEFLVAYEAAVDLAWLGNDIYSFFKEAGHGQGGYNVITVYMAQFRMDMQEAFDHAGAEFRRIWDRFQAAKASMPSFGEEHDNDVRRFVEGLELWVILMLSGSWSFESRRYFGEQGREIMATHTVLFETKAKTLA
ncbi:terpene cyclase [Pleurotus pulmonarius]|nr:terpene cyclase [Pleurotus pulmonarius]